MQNNLVKNIVVFDIDGVLVEPHERLQDYLEGRYADYFAKVHTDTPIPQGLIICRKFLQDPNFRVLFLTGRGDTPTHRRDTLDQLSGHLGIEIRPFQLIMRTYPCPDDEKFEDSVVKPLLFTRAGYLIDEIFMVFEDKTSIVNMWRSRGVLCYQTQLLDL